MTNFKPAVLGGALAAFATTLSAQSLAEATYERGRMTTAKYLMIEDLPYTTKGAELVKVPGEIGKLYGKSGFLAPLRRNYFRRVAVLDGVQTTRGREFSISRQTLTELSGGASASQKKIPVIEGASSVAVDANYDRTGARFEEYTGLFVLIEDWAAIEQTLMAMTPQQQRRYSSKDIRIVEAVLYATGFSSKSGVVVAADGNVTVSGGDSVQFAAQLGGGSTENVSLTMSDSSPLAYSYRMLCWQGTTFDRTEHDEIGARRPSDCGEYGD